MKTKVENIVPFVAIAAWADDEYNEAEQVAMEEVAEVLNVDKKTFGQQVASEIDALKNMSDEQVNEVAAKAAAGVDKQESKIVIEMCLEVVLADSELARDEVSSILVLADILGLQPEDAVLMIADMIKTEPDITVEL